MFRQHTVHCSHCRQTAPTDRPITCESIRKTPNNAKQQRTVSVQPDCSDLHVSDTDGTRTYPPCISTSLLCRQPRIRDAIQSRARYYYYFFSLPSVLSSQWRINWIIIIIISIIIITLLYRRRVLNILKIHSPPWNGHEHRSANLSSRSRSARNVQSAACIWDSDEISTATSCCPVAGTRWATSECCAMHTEAANQRWQS